MDLIFVDFSGNQTHAGRGLYDLKYSFVDKGGPLSLSAVVPISLKRSTFERLYQIRLYDGLNLIWIGRIKEIPRVTADGSADVVTAEGYLQHLTDERVKPTPSLPRRTDLLIQDILAANNALHTTPPVSTDYNKMSQGAFSVNKFDVGMSTTPLTLVQRANDFEGYNWGFWDLDSSDKPRLTFAAHDRGTVHYRVSLRNCRPNLAGKSLDDLLNKAYVLYGDFSETTRTLANSLLTKAGISRAVSLSETSINATDAARVGDAYLAGKKNPGKGELTITGHVWDNNGRRLEAHRIQPGKNILIYDLEPDPADLDTITSTDVINGKNCFKITQVDVDFSRRSASLQLDTPADRLDIMLARLGAA